MDGETFYVLLALALTTFAMVYYARVHLPSRIEQRTRESMKAFSTAIELRFPAREGLSRRVVQVSREVGKRMGFNNQALRKLEMAGRLRDIGLCAIPYSLVNEKPRWEWTHSDNATFNRHPEVGAAMLEMVPSLSNVAEIVRTHQCEFGGPTRKDLTPEARVLKVEEGDPMLKLIRVARSFRDLPVELRYSCIDTKHYEYFAENVGQT